MNIEVLKKIIEDVEKRSGAKIDVDSVINDVDRALENLVKVSRAMIQVVAESMEMVRSGKASTEVAQVAHMLAAHIFNAEMWIRSSMRHLENARDGLKQVRK